MAIRFRTPDAMIRERLIGILSDRTLIRCVVVGLIFLVFAWQFQTVDHLTVSVGGAPKAITRQAHPAAFRLGTLLSLVASILCGGLAIRRARRLAIDPAQPPKLIPNSTLVLAAWLAIALVVVLLLTFG
jgi:hypothetical protein